MNQLVLGAYGHINDFVALTKPRIALLVLFTAFASLYLAAAGVPSLDTVLFTLIGTGLASAGSGVLNNYIDRDIDPLMRRTMHRPLAAGRVAAGAVLWFGLLLTLCSFLLLATFVNYLTASLALFTVVFYVLIYSAWLKRSTHWCTEIGGVAGAMPPLIGWAAVTDSVSPVAVILFLLLFLWQPPHFWALALLRTNEYRDVNVPMLPVVHGEAATKRRMLVYTLALFPVGLGLCHVTNGSVLSYLFCLAVNGIYVWKTVKFCRASVSRQSSMSLFGYSILYIFMMFGLVLFVA